MTPAGMVLTGTRILVTAQRRASDLALALTRRGAEVDIAATLGVESHIDEKTLLAATADLIENPADIVIITTGIGFRGWWETAEAAGVADQLLDALSRSRLVARGPKARGALQAVGLTPDWVAESETSAEIGEFLSAEGVQGARIAVQHHGSGDDGLETTLIAAGVEDVVRLVIYRWGPPPDPAAVADSLRAAADGQYDAIAFTSAPGVAAWLEAGRQADALDAIREQVNLGRLILAAVGPITAEPLQHAGLATLIPDRGRLGTLVRTLIIHLGDEDSGVSTPAGRLRVHATAATLDHQLLPISPNGLAVLRRLTQSPGTVVSRAELLESLPGDSTTPHAAEVAVARLREAIGPNAPIGTVVKRGYRLITTTG